MSTVLGYFIIFYDLRHRSVNGACSPPYVVVVISSPIKFIDIFIHACYMLRCTCTHTCARTRTYIYTDVYVLLRAQGFWPSAALRCIVHAFADM